MLDLAELSFSGAQFDRAAHLRSKKDVSKIESNAKNFVIWRGKILIDQNNFNIARIQLASATSDSLSKNS